VSAHDYHQGLPGYSPGQILHDGCGECEMRGKDPAVAIGHLDQGNFARAWARACKWNQLGLPDISHAEIPLLRVLWAVQLQLDPRGIPVGSLPEGF
jgi:hypothetical protein